MTNQYALGEAVVEKKRQETIRLNASETANMEKTVVTKKMLRSENSGKPRMAVGSAQKPRCAVTVGNPVIPDSV